MADFGSDDDEEMVADDMQPKGDITAPPDSMTYDQDDLGLGDDDDDDDDNQHAAGGEDAAGSGTQEQRAVTRDARDPDRRFCPQCGNMWQPREERTTQTLMLTCRNCGYEEPAHTGKVYENRIKKEVSTRLDTINPEVVQDPTLQRSNNVSCDSCGHNTAVLFQAESGITAVSLSLIFVCCQCGNKWVG